MASSSLDRARLFDVNSYWEAGNRPYTFFAFPSKLADKDGLPPDDDTKNMLGQLQERGIRVGPFTNSPVPHMCYFACPEEDIEQLRQAILEFEESGYMDVLQNRLYHMGGNH